MKTPVLHVEALQWPATPEPQEALLKAEVQGSRKTGSKNKPLIVGFL